LKKLLYLLTVVFFLCGTGFIDCNAEELKIIYVSHSGNDENPGAKEEPLKTIQNAISKAPKNSYIYIASGVYLPDEGLNAANQSKYSSSGLLIDKNGLTIIGGWNESFSKRDKMSELDGKQVLKHVIHINNAENVTLDGLVIRGGNADAGNNTPGFGGGIFINGGKGNLVTNTIISNNSSRVFGGGICVIGGKNHTITALISDNKALLGGGIFLLHGENHTIKGDIINNSAQNWGGGLQSYSGTNFTINATIKGNKAENIGGGIAIEQGLNHTINGIIEANEGKLSSGGIFLSEGKNYTINASIKGNSSMIWGGGLVIMDGKNHTISGVISDNKSINGGGIYFIDSKENESNIFESPSIYRNVSYGISRRTPMSNPQGIDTIKSRGDNKPSDINWVP